MQFILLIETPRQIYFSLTDMKTSGGVLPTHRNGVLRHAAIFTKVTQFQSLDWHAQVKTGNPTSSLARDLIYALPG